MANPVSSISMFHVDATFTDAANSIPNGSGQLIPCPGILPTEVQLVMVYVNVNGAWTPIFGSDDNDDMHSNTFEITQNGVVVYLYEKNFRKVWRSRPVRVVWIQ